MRDALANRRLMLSVFLLSAVVLISFALALRLSFVGDDWIFIDLAGRMNLSDYVWKYIDPYQQTAWYRPVQGMLIRLGYAVYGVDPMPHHLVNVLFHLASCLALGWVVHRALKSWRAGLLAGLLYATFPIPVEGTFKTGVIDPVVSLFFILAIGFWLEHLNTGKTKSYWLAFGAFLVALLSKEIAVTIPVTLFLFDRLWIKQSASLKILFRRYMWFGIAGLLYAPIEYIVVRRSVFVGSEGYAARSPLASNFVDYLAGLAFPWGFIPPWNYAWLIVVAGVLAYLILVRKIFAIVPIVAGAVMAFLPILPFPAVSLRFLYVSLAGSAVLYALAFDALSRRFNSPKWSHVFFAGVIALAITLGGEGVHQSTLSFAEFARVSRVTYRNVWQAHPTLPDGTYLYFVYPPVPGLNLSGMFFTRYGAQVTVGATDIAANPNLRSHPLAYVYYFDEQGNQKEQRVDKEAQLQISPTLPMLFSAAIRLEQVELVNANVSRGDAVILLLDWRALAPIADDYTVGVNLINVNGNRLSNYSKEPRRGQSPTSTWTPDQSIIDAIQLPVPPDAPPGAYRIEITLFDAAKPSGANTSVIIEPVNVLK